MIRYGPQRYLGNTMWNSMENRDCGEEKAQFQELSRKTTSYVGMGMLALGQEDGWAFDQGASTK